MTDTILAQTTHGVVLDPFSIMMGGLVRKGIGSKEKTKQDGFWDNIHGEAKFKQAFVNACHFAETMTVVGPVAQLDWETHNHATANAVWWSCPKYAGDNALFFDDVRRFLGANPHITIGEDKYDIGNHNCLNLFPDVLLNVSPGDHLSVDNMSYSYRQVLERVHHHLFDMRAYETADRTRATNQPGTLGFSLGSPVVALMAVVFSFKRPTSSLMATELTNLGGWPPVCFFLPVLVPAGAKLSTQQRTIWSEQSLRSFVGQTQPSLVSYQLRISSETERSDRTVPYGQPYRLRSVERWGKSADILRSLSDVFRALWSQATQFCAWNTQWNVTIGDDPSVEYPLSLVGDLSLDPIGSGRRIRGHNRFSGKYNMHGLEMIWEGEVGQDDWPTMWGSRKGVMDSVAGSMARSGGKTMMFVLPSFFDQETADNIAPVALTMMRYSGTGFGIGHLADFVSHRAIPNTFPHDVRESGLPGEFVSKSFSDYLMDQTGQGHVSASRMPLLVQCIPSQVVFNKAGTPQVFGLQVNAVDSLASYRSTMDAQKADELYNTTKRLEDFKFMDAFCSGSSKDLTEAFAEAKTGKGKKKTSSSGKLVDEDVVVDLFGGSSDDGML